MVGQRQSPIADASYLRKVRKPLIERRRRERMNNSLLQLKSLLAASIKEHILPNAKLDKADILDLTVRHLTLLQQQQASATMATEAASYTYGFNDCAKETIGYVTSSRLVNETSVRNFSNHLHNSLLAKTGHRDVNQFNSYHAPEPQPTYARDFYSSDEHSDNFSYTASPYYYGYYVNGYCDNQNSSTLTSVATDECDTEKQVEKTNDYSLNVAPLVQCEEKVWRPW